MKKNIILAIAAITTLTLLAGCGAKDTAVSAAPVEESKAVEATAVVETTPEPEVTPEPVEVVAESEVTPEPVEAAPESTAQTFEVNSYGHMVNVIVDDSDITFVKKIESEEKGYKIKLKPSVESDITISVIMDKYTTTDVYDISGAIPPVGMLNWALTDYDFEECDGYLVVKAATVDKNYGIVYPADYPYGYMELDETTGNPVGLTAHIECNSPTTSCDELVELCKELYNKITIVYQEECPMAEEYNEKYLQGQVANWKALFNN